MHLVGAGVQDMGVFGILPMLSHNEDKKPAVPDDFLIRFDKSR